MISADTIVTPDQAGKFLQQLKIEPEHGEAYNIYACGCVIINRDDPCIVTYFSVNVQKNRSCPIHKPTRLVGKYKVCSCGSVFFSNRTQSSKRCKNCPKINSTDIEVLRAYREEMANRPKAFKQYEGPDSTRCYCKNWKKCGDMAIKENLDYRPCLNCDDYEMQHGNHDPMDNLHYSKNAA